MSKSKLDALKINFASIHCFICIIKIIKIVLKSAVNSCV